MILLWIVVGFLFAILELSNPGAFLFLSFSFGSGLSFLSSLFGFGLALQAGLFFLGSVIGFFILKKQAYFLMPDAFQTNVQALVGKKATFVKTLGAGFYEVKVGGELWRAYSQSEISEMTDIIVIGHKGSHLIIGKKG